MASNDSGEKTEKPTPKRLKEAREKGQVAKSPDLSAWVGVLVSVFMLQQTAKRAAAVFPKMLEDMGKEIAHPETARAIKFATNAMWAAATVIAPLLIGLMIVTVVVSAAQVGRAIQPTAKKMKPDFSRLNAFKGLKKMVSPSSWWEVAKSVMKITLLAVIAWPAISNAMMTLSSGAAGNSMWAMAAYTANTALMIVRNVALAGLVVAAADYAVQKRKIMKQLKMSRQELREEFKQQEGNPEMKRAMRSRAAAISRNQMIRMVSMADVVTVNPTHYSVALKYDAAKGAPEVVAKGAGVLAAAIRAEAEKNGIPIVQEAVLTRALYSSCDVGATIPLELYEAVAHLLAFVFSLRAKGRAQGVHELPRPALI